MNIYRVLVLYFSLSAVGFAFSQEEDARVGQAELIRRYDTTLKKPRGD